MKWLAIDIGGANLKSADGEQFGATHPFELWRRPWQLTAALRALIALAPGADHLAVTMTGELADCFTTRAEGVAFIVRAACTAADGRHLRVYLNTGKLVAPTVALGDPLAAAAANWHALATFAGRYARRGQALVMDIGSTTCDVIPLTDGSPTAAGATDPERLAAGELVYTGVVRSPVCALVSQTDWRGQPCRLAQELFATTADVYLTLGDLQEEPHNLHTANGKPATRAAALDRLARSICADRDVFSEADALSLSRDVAAAQETLIASAVEQVMSRLGGEPATVVVSGRGEFLARRVLTRLAVPGRIVSLNEQLGSDLSRCATAHALAVLAREGIS